MTTPVPAESETVVAFPTRTASEIANDMLRVTGECLMSGDIAHCVDLFILPQEVETLTGRRVINSRDEMFELLETMHGHLQDEGITRLDRYCLHAEFITPDRIVTAHQSRNWRGETLVCGPFNTIGTLVRVSGQWRIAYARYAITDDPRREAILMGVDQSTTAPLHR